MSARTDNLFVDGLWTMRVNDGPEVSIELEYDGYDNSAYGNFSLSRDDALRLAALLVERAGPAP
jgi:hypothetical protein